MKKLLLFFGAFIILVSAYAHEFVLLAHKFRLAKGDDLEMHLFVADGFNIDFERPIEIKNTEKFELITNNGKTDLLLGRQVGSLPVVNRKVDFDGLGLVHMERGYAYITQTPANFNAYLKEDHLDEIVIPKDSANSPQRERYTRYIKSLVQSTPVSKDTLYKTILGQKFEIVLLQNPYLLHKGEKFKACVYFMGKPFSGKIITARNRKGSEPSIVETSRTDRNGICSFKIPREGDWFIHATHMTQLHPNQDANWESFWTSYSFGID